MDYLFFDTHCISHRFPSFLIAFARISNCFCPNFGKKQWEIRAKAMGNSEKSNGNFGKKQWEIRAKAMGNSGKSDGKIRPKAMRKFGKRRHIFRANIIAFARISHCFCPNFLLLLHEFPTAFARIFRFNFFFFGGGGGHSAPCPPPPPPPPPTPMFLENLFVRASSQFFCIRLKTPISFNIHDKCCRLLYYIHQHSQLFSMGGGGGGKSLRPPNTDRTKIIFALVWY